MDLNRFFAADKYLFRAVIRRVWTRFWGFNIATNFLTVYSIIPQNPSQIHQNRFFFIFIHLNRFLSIPPQPGFLLLRVIFSAAMCFSVEIFVRFTIISTLTTFSITTLSQTTASPSPWTAQSTISPTTPCSAASPGSTRCSSSNSPSPSLTPSCWSWRWSPSDSP